MYLNIGVSSLLYSRFVFIFWYQSNQVIKSVILLGFIGPFSWKRMLQCSFIRVAHQSECSWWS